MKIEELITLPEGTTLEFKENGDSRSKILSTVIAFANTSGGKIIIGIQDKTRRLIGVENPQTFAESIVNMIHDIVEPRLLPNIEIISYQNLQFVSIEIYPSALRPHYERSKGKTKSTYIRIGSTTRLADGDLLKTIERTSLPKSFDEEICYASSYEDIDFTAISQLFAQKRTISVRDLVTLGIIIRERDNSLPTVGGVLLFSKRRLEIFPDSWIQLGVFSGVDKKKILDSQQTVALLPDMIEEAMYFIGKNMRMGIRTDDIRHNETWEIPKIALREALINAVLHSDYSLRGSPIRVSIFSNRIEIENSALLPWGLTLSDLQEGISKLRNPVIARAFKELGFIEQWGSGIQRMNEACQEVGLAPPLFSEIGPRIRVTFFKQQISVPRVNHIDSKIIQYINEKKMANSQDITILTGLSRRSAINRLLSLVKKGFIVEISTSPTDPKRHYIPRKFDQ